MVAFACNWQPRNYGAAGDGATDDAPAFDALFTAMAAKTATLKRQRCDLQPLTYVVNAPIVISESGLGLIGQYGAKIKASASFPAGQPVIDVVKSSGNAQIKDVRLSDFAIERVNKNGPAVRVRAGLCANLDHLRVSNCDPYFVFDSPGSAETESCYVQSCECLGGASLCVDVGQVGGSATHGVALMHSEFVGSNAAGSIGARYRNGSWGYVHFCDFLTVKTVVQVASQSNFCWWGPRSEGSSGHTWLSSDAGSTGTVSGRSITASAGTWGVLGV
jgi:hypothetical protein